MAPCYCSLLFHVAVGVEVECVFMQQVTGTSDKMEKFGDVTSQSVVARYISQKAVYIYIFFFYLFIFNCNWVDTRWQ
jgi:hypothetical protein